MNIRLGYYIIVAVFILLCDRISKIIALTYCLQEMIQVNNYISFFVEMNRGFSWGILNSSHDILFLIVSFVVLLLTFLLCQQALFNYRKGFLIWGHVFIIAGSISNFIDRIYYHGVVDFILCSYNGWFWPVFNIADMFIVWGVFIMMYQYDVLYKKYEFHISKNEQ